MELVEPDPVENTGSIYSHLMEETRPQTQPCAYTLHHSPVPIHHSRQGQQGGCAYHTPQQARTAPDHRRQGKPKSKGDGDVSGAKVLLWLCRGAGRGKPDIFADKTQKKFSISLHPGGILKDYCYGFVTLYHFQNKGDYTKKPLFSGFVRGLSVTFGLFRGYT